MPFAEFDLLPDIHKAVKAMGFSAPTPVQTQAIPPAMEGRDVLGSAQTGSGKTVAFVAPLLDKILRDRAARGPAHGSVRKAGHPVAMILVPTRELAAQVESTVKDLGRFCDVGCALIIGGEGYARQLDSLKKGAEIVVATPGRLMDHQRSGALNLGGVRTAVLDEADRMLDMGFMPDVRRIMQSLPKDRQTLMFSATIPAEVERAVKEFMREPVRISIDRPRAPAAGITQFIYPVPVSQKYDLLKAILRNVQITSALIFTRTKMQADRLSRILESAGFSVAVLHADRTQAQRTQAMEDFRHRRNQFLVATDLASRGIDVKHVSHVINFDVPQHPEDYVHRIGRTGRAFTVGDAITLMCIDEHPFVAAIEAFIGQVIPRAALPDFPYASPPILQPFKAPSLSDRFRMRRRTIPRSSRMRFPR